VIRRLLLGGLTAGLVVLVARSLAYATVPGPSAQFLAHRAGGPAFPVLVLAVVGIGAVAAVIVCWLVAFAVRERALLERREAEPFALARTCALALGLALATSLAGGLFEAYLHWRAGLGWHGLHCLVGPVHRDLLPFDTGLSLVAAACLAAARHVALWMRRTFARLAAQLPALPLVESTRVGGTTTLRVASRIVAAPARGPPALG
jgi:hypothetical protein